jgi:tetratricopeptide (TPR) repeat protein
MTIAVKIAPFLMLCLQLLQAGNFAEARSSDLDPQQWAAKLSRNDNSGNDEARRLDSILDHVDSVRVFEFLDLLQGSEMSQGNLFQARFKCVKARQVFYQSSSHSVNQFNYVANINRVKGVVANLFYSALDVAYATEDDYLVAFVSYTYAITIAQFGDVGVAIMYAKNSVDLYDQLSYDISPYMYQFLAETLFSVGEYKECIEYAKKALTGWQRSSQADKFGAITCSNTVGLGYQRQQKYDSALLFYSQSLTMAERENIPVWTGIVSGNMAQIYYQQKHYEIAYPLFIKDYRISRDSGVYDNAANSLQWASRTSLALGRKERALAEVRESFRLLKLLPDVKYLRNAYFTAMQLFRAMSSYDSAFYYSNLYGTLNDSLERAKASNSLAITRAKLSDMASQYTNQKLNGQKRTARTVRNIVITFIVIFSFFILLNVTRSRKETKLAKQKAEQEKLLREQEVASARDQLTMVNTDMSEKNGLIEKLEEQLRGNEATAEYQAILSEITRLTILTETDWSQFKSIFETIYPGFFIKLTNKFPEITAAEQRMAVLTRLHLNSRQIASMLGISVDSVHKSRQRLRQRLKVGAETNLNEMVAAL